MEGTVTVTGLAEAIRALNQIDPLLKKQFRRDAVEILRPAINEIKAAYPDNLGTIGNVGGIGRGWAPKGRQIFPFDVQRARRRVTVKIESGRRAKSVISIIQRDAAASVIEFAGKKSSSGLSKALTFRSGRPARYAWPAAQRKGPEIRKGMEKACRAVMQYTAGKVA